MTSSPLRHELPQVDWSTWYRYAEATVQSLERAYAPSRILDVMCRHLPRGEDALVLELGCAPGRWLAWVGQHLGTRVVGVELNAKGARMTRALYSRLGVIQGDASRLPLRTASCDAIYSIGLLEHFDDPSGIIREARRVLRADGCAIWVVPNLTAGSVCRWHWRTMRPGNFEAHRPYTLDELAALVESGGFVVTEREFNGLYVPHAQRALALWPWPRMLWRLERLRTAANLIVISRPRKDY